MNHNRPRRPLEVLTAQWDHSPVSAKGLCDLGVPELAVSGAGITAFRRAGSGRAPHPGLVHTTDTISAMLEHLQWTLAEGPGVDAFDCRAPVLVPDLADQARRWPSFAPNALEVGAVALFSFPLRIVAVKFGVLTLYRNTAGDLRESHLMDALLLADLATLAVLHDVDQHSKKGLASPMNMNAEVHQACGMVKVQLGTSIEQALLPLRAYSYAHGLPITEVAHQVVTRQLRFDPPNTDRPRRRRPEIPQWHG
jgi:hypothetical protein